MNQESKIKSLLDALLRYFEDFNGEVPYFEPTKDGSRYVEVIHGDSRRRSGSFSSVRISTPCRLRRAVAVRR